MLIKHPKHSIAHLWT